MPRKLLMTGTPIQNNLTELWSLTHFCMPLIFGTLEQFLSDFKEAGDPSRKLSLRTWSKLEKINDTSLSFHLFYYIHFGSMFIFLEIYRP